MAEPNEVSSIYSTIEWGGGILVTLALGMFSWVFARIASLEKDMRDTEDDLSRQLREQAERGSNFREQIARTMIVKEDLAAMEARLTRTIEQVLPPRQMKSRRDDDHTQLIRRDD